MLLQFRVKNYRSIKDEALLSLIARDTKARDERLQATQLKTPAFALSAAVVYGANASGKSTLLAALAFMRGVVADSATVVQAGQTFNVQPFRLDAETMSRPSEFELTFVLDGIRHQYGFAINAERVTSEYLLVYRATKPQQWFSRTYDEKAQLDRYEFSSYLTGPRKLWQESTRSNALFLSTAVQLNSELLRPVFQWITEKILFFGAGLVPEPQYTTELLKDSATKLAVMEFLRAADVGISDLTVVPRKGFMQQITLHPGGGIAQLNREERESLAPQFVHKTSTGSATFELHEESQGTQRLFLLAAPVLDVLQHGRILVVDELDSSLHTLLVRQLVGMFHNAAINPHGAQLIFSTHDTSLLDQNLFRRDQVWFTEKLADHATALFPLTDFSPRKGEALERGYLSGRYGALPLLDFPHH